MAAGPLQRLVQYTLRDTDTEEELRQKRVFVPIMLVINVVLISVYPALGQLPFHTFQAINVGMDTCLVSSLGYLIWVYSTRSQPAKVVGLTMLGMAIGAIVADVSVASALITFRPYTFVVMSLDLQLAVDTPRTYQYAACVAVAIWVLLFHIEDAYRLGIYDIEGFSEESEAASKRCGCANPPCAMGSMAGFMWVAPLLVVLLGDYFATRSFAEGLRAQRVAAEVSVEVADRVANCLVRFDLVAAGDALQQAEGRLPARLFGGFASLIRNLASYRPFLPESCFEESDEEARSELTVSDAGTPTREDLTGGPTGGAVLVAWEVNPAEQTASPAGEHLAASSSALPQDGVSPLFRKGHSLREPHTAGDAQPRLELSAWQVSDGSVALTPRLSSPWSPAPQGEARGHRDSMAGKSTRSSGGAPEIPKGDAEISTLRRTPELARQGHAATYRGVTLLVGNSSVALAPRHQLDVDAMSAYFADEVAFFSAEVKAQCGVTDLLSADHFLASFGAVKSLGRHSSAGTQAARVIAGRPSSAEGHGLPTRPSTTSVCSGRALCGDFGSAASLRFMVIGGVRPFAAATGLAAAAWRVGTLIDSATHSDVEQLWSCRLRKRVHFPDVARRPIDLWEVVEARTQCAEHGEWMYQLSSMGPDPWESYNAAVDAWCASALLTAAPAAEGELGVASCAADIGAMQAAQGASPAGRAAAAEGAVGRALQAVRELSQRGCPPPVGEFTAEAFAGRPAPLSPRGARHHGRPLH
eukprot:TRINITY_DN2851_c0_g2_i1.p1 TRINITY_DN2851_c0_g2~~TRINITY_DN2851_c0_g2_i1.p1  ORF type:complete len:755 (+),score=150.33 TRINITY_DN2851_c0_g2_i1:142-2406(+)